MALYLDAEWKHKSKNFIRLGVSDHNQICKKILEFGWSNNSHRKCLFGLIQFRKNTGHKFGNRGQLNNSYVFGASIH